MVESSKKNSFKGRPSIEPSTVSLAPVSDMPIMVHIAHPPPGIEEFLPLLRAGDIITHCFTGLPIKLFDDDGRLLEVARRAIDLGVILDIGHGAGSFAFRTAEAALTAGIKPHVISTDIHQMSIAGPMFDLPTCLSKLLALGLDLREVVAMATAAPARNALMTKSLFIRIDSCQYPVRVIRMNSWRRRQPFGRRGRRLTRPANAFSSRIPPCSTALRSKKTRLSGDTA